MGFEDALQRVGSDGLYQRAFTIFGAFACIVPLMQNLASIFTLKMYPMKCNYGNGTLVGKYETVKRDMSLKVRLRKLQLA